MRDAISGCASIRRGLRSLWLERVSGGQGLRAGASRPYTIDELNARRQYQSGTFAKNPYSTAPQDAVGSGPPIEQGPFVNNLGGNPFITPEDMEILKKIPRNLRGQNCSTLCRQRSTKNTTVPTLTAVFRLKVSSASVVVRA